MSDTISIEWAFKPASQSVNDTFSSETGIGYRIPSYQRRFDWEEQNIAKLFDDIRWGMRQLRQRDELTFLGAVILVKESDQRVEPHYQGSSFEIVDGQQRLSTLAIMCAILRQKLLSSWQNARPVIQHQQILETFENAVEASVDRLFEAFAQLRHSATSQREPIPRVVREDDDERAYKKQFTKYNSLLASYLYQYAVSIHEQKDFQFMPPASAVTSDVERFKIQVDAIYREIANLAEGTFPEDVSSDEGDSEPSMKITPAFIAGPEGSRYRQLLREFVFDEVLNSGKEIREAFQHLNEPAVIEVLQLLTCINYVLDRIVITSVTLDHSAKDYAYDIFEALNTTGEPLTALETIKPKIHKEDPNWNDPMVGARAQLDELEQYIYRPIEGEKDSQAKREQAKQKRVRLSKDIVTDFALYFEGTKESQDLRKQSAWIASAFDKFSSNRKSWEFSYHIKEVGFYRRDFFDYEQVPMIGNRLQREFSSIEPKEQQQVHLCLAFLERTGTTLTIPILARYWVYAREDHSFGIFRDAVLALTAYVAIRRSATDGTAGIDTELRAVMKRGAKKGSDSQGLALCEGASQTNLPSVEEFKRYLWSYLEGKGFDEKETWLRRARSIPIYRKAASVAKFMLLVAANFSEPDKERPHILVDVRKHLGDFLSYAVWRSEIAESLEHVAPQSMDKSGWEPDLQDEEYIVDCLGNLTLLPERANNSISNASWKRKQQFYKAMAARNDEELRQALEDAKEAGAQIKKTAEEDLKIGQYSPIIASVATCKEWNKKVVIERSENLCSRAWDTLSGWLS